MADHARKLAVEAARGGLSQSHAWRFTTRRWGGWWGIISQNLRKPKQKSRARLAPPQPRPTSPVNGAGGITGCRNDSQAPGEFQSVEFFFTRLSDERPPNPAVPLCWFRDRHGARDQPTCHRFPGGIFAAFAVSLTLGAVPLALGRDLYGAQDPQQNPQEALGGTQAAAINRAAKADRIAGPARSDVPTQTISLRLSGVSDTSVLVPFPSPRRRAAAHLRPPGPGSATASRRWPASPLSACSPRSPSGSPPAAA